MSVLKSNHYIVHRGFTPKAFVILLGRFSVSEFFGGLVVLFLFLAHDHPGMVSVIMVMYITGRNEFKCFVRLFEL